MTDFISQLRLTKTSSRRLGVAGAILGVSALVHLMVMLADGGSWEGAVSFRKPITFGISVGLIFWTCGWVMDRLPDRPRLERILAMVLIVSGIAEVALITVQAWRGVPSHFNVFTPEDSTVFSLMGAAIGVFSLGLAALFVWSILQRPSDKPTRLAVLAGMALVMTGLGIGPWIIDLGMEMTERLGVVPDTVLAGEAGVAKFPHAMAFHGIQLFIGVVIFGRIRGLSDSARLRMTRLVVTGYLAWVGWSIVHTNAGRAPADLSGIETGLLVLGTALMVWAAAVAFTGRRPSRSRDDSNPTITIAS